MNRLLKFAAVLAGLGFIYTYPRYQREKESAIARLRLGRTIFQSPTGPLEYQVVGQGTPVLSIHGGGGGYDQGMLTAQGLDPARYQIIAISRPGYKRTPLSTGRRPEDQADAAFALLNHLGIERAVVVGVSAGGLSSLQFAVCYPDRCAGLVLLSAVTPSILAHLPGPYMVPMLKALLLSDYVYWLILRFGVQGLITALGRNEPERLQNPATQKMINDLFEGMFPVSLWREGTLNDVEQVYAMNPTLAAQVTVPTLLIHGTHDTAAIYAAAQAAAKMIPNARLMTIENGSHLIAATHMAEIRAAIDAFVAET
ncbi:MAG: alpha/beta hydrolase [Candidatus Methanoperedens sp.]|nr:alpha/beta hydrolase [Candidatus Methanoperedens sp.]